MHICHEEILAFLSLFPFVSFYIPRIRDWFHEKKKCFHDKESG
jgi:hypothetical protein